ncbi:hypothetical protein HUJ04_005378 [Dendroctonus ponderosae]|nr:hypothetical protein HUJ04_005378 [Dendroctonus ponderosae]
MPICELLKSRHIEKAHDANIGRELTLNIKETEDVCSDDIDVTVTPDGGWGWVIVFASFMCNLVVDGIIFSYGTFIKGIASELGVTRSEAAMVRSIMSGFYLIVGTFASAIANKFGFRLVAVVGALVGATAFVVSSYGLIGGIGFGFIYVPSVITVGFYFKKWRALATVVGVCGSGIGTFLFAPMRKLLIDSIGWRHALLTQSAIVLCCAFFGMLFRPLNDFMMMMKLKSLDEKEPEMVMDASLLPAATVLQMEAALKYMPKHDHQSSISRVFSSHHNPEPLHLSDEKRLSALFVLLSERSKKCEEMHQPLYRDDIFFGQGLERLPQYTSHTSVQYNLAVTRLPTKEKTHSCQLYPRAVKLALATLLDFSMLRSPTFLILAVGGFFTMMEFYTAVLLISSVGIANTLGRVLCGVLSPFPSVNALFFTNAAHTIGGIATIVSGASPSQEFQFLYIVIFGLAISCFASLRSIIVVDLLGLERLTNAFGLLLLFQGVTAMIGAPLAGAFTDLTGSFDATFYLRAA